MDTGESWRPVLGYENLYEASDMGGIRSLVNQNGRRLHPKVLSPAISTTGGYFKCLMYKDGSRKNRTIHRLVLEAFRGPCPDRMECAHLDGNSQNNRIENLAWVTHVENMRHRESHGKTLRGESHSCAKLSEKDVVSIKNLLSNGGSVIRIATRFMVRKETIRAIKDSKTWRHI